MKEVVTKVFLATAVLFTASVFQCDFARCEDAQTSLQSTTAKDVVSADNQYVELAREKVLECWSKNPVALSAKHPTTVSFSLLKNGTVSQLSIKSSSGNSHQDYAAIETIIAARFAPLPSDNADAITVEVTVGSLHKK